MDAAKRFAVVDSAGNTRTVVETAEPIPGPGLIGGGRMPQRPVFTLDDGTRLEPLVGAQQFVDRRTGAVYKRA